MFVHPCHHVSHHFDTVQHMCIVHILSVHWLITSQYGEDFKFQL